MQERPPSRVTFDFFRDMSGKKNVPSIPTIHHSLRDVDAGTSDVGLFVQVGDFIDWTAVNPHPHRQVRMSFERSANFQRAQDWRFRTVTKNQSATVAGW